MPRSALWEKLRDWVVNYGAPMQWWRFLGRRPIAAEGLRGSELERALEKPRGHTRALVAAAEAIGSDEQARATAALETWPPRRWLAFDASRLDAWEWVGGESAPKRGWPAAVDKPDAPTLLIVLASTHRDGFLRERSTRLLAMREGTVAAAALAVRTVDHVPQVREVARGAISSRLDPADAAAIVPVLLAASRRDVATGLVEEYVNSLPPESLSALTRSADRDTRRLAVEKAPLTVAELVAIAAEDGDMPVRHAAARRAIAQNNEAAVALLQVRPTSVRALAVSAADAQLVRGRLLEFLLDRSAQLRRAAQARAQALGTDTAAVYREHVPLRAAVLGLGEVGAARDVDVLLSIAAEEHSAAVRRAAIRSLGRLAPREVLVTVLPAYVGSDQPSLAREAGSQLRRVGFTLQGDELDRMLRSPNVWTRQAALGIALGGRRWDGPVAALALYADPEESLREYARTSVRAWLNRHGPAAASPTADQAARLQALLDRTELPAELEREIRFHAGL